MAARSFDADAQLATETSQPVPRGIAFQITTAGAEARVQAVLADWQLRPFDGLPGWWEAIVPAPDGQPLALAGFWQTLRAVRAVPGVNSASVEPLFLVATPQPSTTRGAEAFAAGTRQAAFALWGMPYDAWTLDTIEKNRQLRDWHLRQLRVPDAWELWRARRPGQIPGADVLVGHPDTGYSSHPDLRDRLLLPGKSFLRDEDGNDEPDARDDLRVLIDTLFESPGHGTATASVIVSAGRDEPGNHVTFGVAPGALVLPLRVSRSVIHFDFSNVARAIAFAVDAGVSVISMSLGGPFGSEVVHESIRKAHAAGVIVVAAAGNLLPSTAFPAAYPEVIAAAATNAASLPWRFSGFGRLVDIAAPGEDVWRALAARSDDGEPDFTVSASTGTSYATACVAGLASLWLSYHGGREAIAGAYGNQPERVPLAFQYLLGTTANQSPGFVVEGRHGSGIPDAAKLLSTPLPPDAALAEFKDLLRSQQPSAFTFFTGLLTGGRAIADEDAPPAPLSPAERAEQITADHLEQAEHIQAFFPDIPPDLLQELLPLLATNRHMVMAFVRWQPGASRLPLLETMLGEDASGQPVFSLSPELRLWLNALRSAEVAASARIHQGVLTPAVAVTFPSPEKPQPPPPAFRQLRVYSFDPSLSTTLSTAPVHQVTIPVRWEPLAPGPIGEYLEVIDVDPASDCIYSPVDLNHPHVLAEDGLAPSEGNPQFHQQMVYAVAMNAIHRFELALGRPIFWSPLRPWLHERPEEQSLFTPESLPAGADGWADDPVRTRYVQRLRIYPHALREANAFYSSSKRALLFGYFPSEDETGREYPGGVIFSCLSHDIVVHETAHALVDGMHPYFNEPTNEDVFAFHEAFADIMALFQHFTYPEVLRHQIAHSRGDLEVDNLLGQLAQQFGRATGHGVALRTYIGQPDEQGVWRRRTPDQRALETRFESHDRGSVLVAAVFDAFLALYNERTGDLLRLATGGTGVLLQGEIHPDLANRLAMEAAQTADEVLRVCIRAMDYVPPVDITFGEFLRAIITADYDLSPGAQRTRRVAFIEAFRAWGIYPRDVTTLSEESLRWRGPEPGSRLQQALHDIRQRADDEGGPGRGLTSALEGWQPGKSRRGVFEQVQMAQAGLHTLLEGIQQDRDQEVIRGLDLRPGASFSVGNLRPARRIGPLGEFRTEAIVEVVQTDRSWRADDDGLSRRGGATLVIDLNDWTIRYVISKSLYRKLPGDPRDRSGAGALLANRILRRLRIAQEDPPWQGEMDRNLRRQLAATYSSAARRRRLTWDEPFALLHRGF